MSKFDWYRHLFSSCVTFPPRPVRRVQVAAWKPPWSNGLVHSVWTIYRDIAVGWSEFCQTSIDYSYVENCPSTTVSPWEVISSVGDHKITKFGIIFHVFQWTPELRKWKIVTKYISSFSTNWVSSKGVNSKNEVLKAWGWQRTDSKMSTFYRFGLRVQERKTFQNTFQSLIISVA